VAGDGQFIFQLDPVSQTVVEVEIGRLVVGIRRIVIGDKSGINLPMAIARSLGVVGEKRRPALRLGCVPGDEQLQPEQRDEQAPPGGHQEKARTHSCRF